MYILLLRACANCTSRHILSLRAFISNKLHYMIYHKCVFAHFAQTFFHCGPARTARLDESDREPSFIRYGVLVGSLKFSFAKVPNKRDYCNTLQHAHTATHCNRLERRDYILQKRPMILSILLTVATAYVNILSTSLTAAPFHCGPAHTPH